jgi:hypothetical protein
VLFAESFDDANLQDRGWYDHGKVRIAGQAVAGNGCIEYEWVDGKADVQGSTPARRLFEPTDRVYLRYYLKLSKGWGWSGRNYHPHLTHFLTTENGRWHGPAASHLTLYIEPVGGKLRLAAQDIQPGSAARPDAGPAARRLQRQVLRQRRGPLQRRRLALRRSLLPAQQPRPGCGPPEPRRHRPRLV